MKRILLLIGILLCMTYMGYQAEKTYVVGEFRLASREVSAYLLSQETAVCDCCPPLWNGGIATTTDKLTGIEIEDMAYVRLLGGYKLCLECIEIIPCILINNQLIGWQGVIAPQGDILIYSHGYAYRFTVL